MPRLVRFYVWKVESVTALVRVVHSEICGNQQAVKSSLCSLGRKVAPSYHYNPVVNSKILDTRI